MALTAAQNHSHGSVFNAALPYGVGTLIVAGAGIAVSLATTEVGGVIGSIALATFGSYAFLGVLSAYCFSRTSREFDANVWKHMAIAVVLGHLLLIRMACKIPPDNPPVTIC